VDSRLSPQDVALSARKIAEEFASLLLMEMLKSMRATLSGEGLDGDASSARDTYAALADVEVTRTLAKRDGMGLVHFLAQRAFKPDKGIPFERMGRKTTGLSPP